MAKARHAAGGIIPHPGSPTNDRMIAVTLGRGYFVANHSVLKRYGRRFLESINKHQENR